MEKPQEQAPAVSASTSSATRKPEADMFDNIFPRHYQEFKESFVDDDLIGLNVASLEGIAAQHKYFEAWEGKRTNVGAPADRLLEKTNYLLQGTWYVYIETANGLVPHFKPDKPRTIFDEEKGTHKVIKYEQVKGSKNGALLPKMTYRHVELIAENNNIKKYPTGDLSSYCPEAWEWLADNKKIKIGITEGWKKTLALLSVGVPTIGLSGVWNFNNSGIDKTLLPVFNNFKGHEFIIYYDNDKKKKTKKAVNGAAYKLARALTSTGISKYISRAIWQKSKEKGIDDYLYANNSDLSALEYEPIVAGDRPEKVDADMILCREFLTTTDKRCPVDIKKELDSHRLIALVSHKGGGKTTLLSDYVYEYQMMGVKVIIPTHRVQLMNELSRKFNVSNANNWHSSLESIFGLTVCVDSLHDKSSVRFTQEIIELFKDCILIIDEVDQVLDHLMSAMTEIKNHRRQVIKNLMLLMNHAQKIIISSADISQETIDFFEVNTGEKAFIIENTFKPKGGSCKIYTQSQPCKFWDDLRKEIAKKKKTMIFTSSQKVTSTWSTQTLEASLKQEYPHLKIMRIDAETVADKERPEYNCFSNFNEFIEREKADIFLLSPALETGIDIISTHFDSYWGMNWGVTPVNSFAQAMARIRANIPRRIWSGNSFMGKVGNGSCFSSGLEYSQHQQKKVNEMIFHHFNSDFNPYLNDSCLKFWATRGAIVNTQGQQLVTSVIRKFRKDYQVVEIDDEDLDKGEKQEIKGRITEIKKLNIEKQYQAIISAPEIDDQTLDAIKRKKEKNSAERYIERKNNTIRYIAPQSKQILLTLLILAAEDKGLFPKINLYWLLTQGKAISHKMDKHRILDNEFILDTNRKCLAPKIVYLEKFGITDIINNPNEEYHNEHPLIKKVGAKIRSGLNSLKETKATIRDFWNMGRLSASSTNWNLCQWALGLLGFGMKKSKRTNKRRYYQLVDLTGEVRQLLVNSWNVERVSLLEEKEKREKGDKCLNNIYINITEHLSPPEEVTQKDDKCLNHTNNNMTEDLSPPGEVAQKGDKCLNNIDINIIKHLSPPGVAELPNPPSYIYKGDVTLYPDDDKFDFAKVLGLIIDVAPTTMPELSNLSPLEAFKYQISQFGWDVIRKGCEFSQELLEKVKYYSNILLNNGEWQI